MKLHTPTISLGLCSNLDHLFTYKSLPDLSIPNTTNHLDGGKFSDLKNRIRVHRGLSKKLKLKVVDFYMLNNGLSRANWR